MDKIIYNAEERFEQFTSALYNYYANKQTEVELPKTSNELLMIQLLNELDE